MRRAHSTRWLILASLALASCGGSRSSPEAPTTADIPAVRPLAQLAAQRVILTPAFSLATGEALGWSAKVASSRDFLRMVDDELGIALAGRGLRTQWIYPADLVQAARANPTYAADPYSLGVNVLRNPAVKSGDRLGNPLITQLRTMIALHNDARAVLVPVEVRFQPAAATGQGVASLRLALLDGRLGDVRWIGTVRSEAADSLSRAVVTSLAAHVADLITAP